MSLPQIAPTLPLPLLQHSAIREGVLRLAALLHVSDTFVAKLSSASEASPSGSQ